MPIENETPGSDRWWDAFDDLEPAQQEQVLYDFEFNQANVLPPSFGGTGYAPELGQEAYDLFGMGGGVDIPELTTRGAVDPFDLTQQARRINVGQDYGAAILDNILSGMAGPGAYDVGAFTPTYEYGEPLNLPGRRKAEQMAQYGGYEGFLARAILEDQMSPAQAEAAMWELATAPAEDPDRTPADEAARQEIISTLPTAPRPTGPTPPGGAAVPEGRAGREAYDETLVRETAATLWNDLMEDPEFAHEEGGRFYERTPEEAMVKTPQMEFFDKYGIPYPTAQYSDPQYTEAALNAQGTTPESRAVEQELFGQEMAGLERGAEQAFGQQRAAEESTTQLRDLWSQLQANPNMVAQRGPASNPYGLGAESMEAARTAAGLDYERAMEEWEASRGGGGQPNVLQQPSTPPPLVPPGTRNYGEVVPNLYDTNQPTQPQQALSPQQPTRPRPPFGTIPRLFSEPREQTFMDAAMQRAAEANDIPTTGALVRTDRQGNTVPYTFGEIPEDRGMFDWASSIFGVSPQEARPLTRQMINEQRQRSTEAERRQQSRTMQRDLARWRDPQLNEVRQSARLAALAQTGRTPFQDVVTQRQLGLRALGL